MDPAAAEIQSIAEGGIWNDKNVEESLDWAGETASADAAIDSTVIHQPKSHKEVEQDVLSTANIGADIVNIITSRVEKSLLRSSGSSENSLLQMIESRLKQHDERVGRWMDSQEKRLSQIESDSKESRQNSIDKLDEKIAILENKIGVVIGSITQHGPEETRLIHEAYKIIMDRKAADEDGDSEPSIYARMDSRVEELNRQMRALEPHSAQGSRAVIDNKRQEMTVRKKFGRMM